MGVKRQCGLLQSPYDPRDYKFKDIMPPLKAIKIPDNYETPAAPFVYDQGSTSYCGACSSNMLRYLQETAQEQSELDEPLSPAFTYGNRLPGEDFEGMYLRSVAKKWVDDGGVLQSKFDFWGTYLQCKQKFQERRTELLELAKPFRISSFYTCNSRKEIQTGIMESKGVLIGIPIYPNFYKPDSQGRVEFVKGFESEGGHAVLLRGWKTVGNKLYWLLQNSWGKSWGFNGACWLSEEYPWMENGYVFLDYVTETKIKEYKEKHS